jgi:hypothetical protein
MKRMLSLISMISRINYLNFSAKMESKEPKISLAELMPLSTKEETLL